MYLTALSGRGCSTVVRCGLLSSMPAEFHLRLFTVNKCVHKTTELNRGCRVANYPPSDVPLTCLYLEASFLIGRGMELGRHSSTADRGVASRRQRPGFNPDLGAVCVEFVRFPCDCMGFLLHPIVVWGCWVIDLCKLPPSVWGVSENVGQHRTGVNSV